MSVAKAINKLLGLKTNYVYGFDLHGVTDTDPEGYKDLFNMLRGNGHKVCIISGPPKKQLYQELENLGISVQAFATCNPWANVDEVFSVVDFLKEKGVKMNQDKKGNWWAGDIDWWSAKAQICRSIGADFMFDDTYTYKQFFANTHTKFIHMK